MVRTFITAALVASSFMVADQSLSAVINSGVDTTIRHYVFGSGSTATYHPSTLMIIIEASSGEDAPEPEMRNISGSFDAEFSRYWWEYEPDNSGSSTAIAEQYWLRLSNSEVTGGVDWADLVLFDSFLRSDGVNYVSFNGDSGPCTFPAGPDSYCTGFSSGAAPSASGGFFEGELTLAGVSPLGAIGGSYYSYHLTATSVPLPADAWLFGSSIAAFAFFNRRRVQKYCCRDKSS